MTRARDLEEPANACARCQNPADRAFCHGCEQRVHQALRELPDLYVRLHLNLPRSASPLGDRVSGSREPSMPPRGDVQDCIDQIEGLPADIEDALRAVLGWTPRPRRGGRGASVQATCRWLGQAMGPLLASPFGADTALELLALQRQAVRALSQDRLTHRLPAPCPSCDLLALVRHDGASQVDCDPRLGGCGRAWSEGDYQRLCVVLVNEAREATA